MTKIHETNYYSLNDDETADLLTIFRIDNEDELYMLWDIEDSPNRFREYEELTGCYNEHGVMPGALFNRYTFKLIPPYFIIHTESSYNV